MSLARWELLCHWPRGADRKPQDTRRGSLSWPESICWQSLGSLSRRSKGSFRWDRDQCFDEMCFAVVGVTEVPGLVAGDDGKVERVSIRVTNHGHSGGG